ncbi:MAG TPA: DUF3800 domain-containing protein [Longimicrobiaceae bacterium]|jgi:hypothetical protein|nr:DUF3800 domain-containing protein [Longimicrobiaceae bacterium]
MARIGIFADESGNFDFSRGPGASRYFILTTVACADYGVGDALIRLRREIAWQGHGVNSEFHATEDSLEVRGRVFRLLCEHEFRIDVTILEKAKAAPCTRASEDAFYQHAWQHHLAHVAPQIVSPTDELFVVGASLGTKKKRALMHRAVRDVVDAVAPCAEYRTVSWSADSEPCLQVADYCCWALRRKWELCNLAEYNLIARKIVTEVDLWAGETELYY